LIDLRLRLNQRLVPQRQIGRDLAELIELVAIRSMVARSRA